MRMLIPDVQGALSPAGLADVFDWPAPERPWVRAVMVATADGSANSPKGQSAGISSPSDRLLFATVRGLADVILVGAQTVRTEGYGQPKARPELSHRRHEAGQAERPRIAVITRGGELNLAGRLFTEPGTRPIVLAPGTLPADRRAALEPVAELVLLGTHAVPLVDAVAALAERGLTRIVCEGGPRLLAELAAADLLDELCLTVTPLLAGGSFADQHAPRILSGTVLADAPRGMRLDTVLESDGTLFLKYLLRD